MAQSFGTLRAKVGETASVLPFTPWVPWHSSQGGPFGSPLKTSLPCVLLAYCWTTASWQEPQFTFAVSASQGRSWLGAAPAWHCEQRFSLCREAATSAASTHIDRPSLAFSSFRPWHFRQSASAIPWS